MRLIVNLKCLFYVEIETHDRISERLVIAEYEG